LLTALKRVLFPTLGKPTIPACKDIINKFLISNFHNPVRVIGLQN
jgi:hypothetical protein